MAFHLDMPYLERFGYNRIASDKAERSGSSSCSETLKSVSKNRTCATVMSKIAESSSALPMMLPSLEQSLKEKKLWLAIAGIVVTLASSFVTWLTVSLSLANLGSFSFAPSLTVVFSGYDATWNVGYGLLGFRIIYIQLLSTGLTFLALLLGIFRIAPSK